MVVKKDGCLGSVGGPHQYVKLHFFFAILLIKRLVNKEDRMIHTKRVCLQPCMVNCESGNAHAQFHEKDF